MREIIYYVTTSLDGFIAHLDGSLDGFLWNEQYGAALLKQFPETFPAHLRPPGSAEAENKWFDTVLMGRKTYEVGSKVGITNPYPTLKQYVFSRSMTERPDKHVELVREHAVETAGRLKAEAGKAIWLCGGGELASLFIETGLIDRLIIKLNPVVFGTGIPLFGRGKKPIALELTDSEIHGSGHVLLHYTVRR